MKFIILIISLIISVAASYVLFIPSSIVNLLIDTFISDNNLVIKLSDFALSNLVFLVIYDGLTFLSSRINIKK